MAQNRRWYKLDNIGTYYAAQAMTQDQTVFRLSATFKDNVSATHLQAALLEVLSYYPNFNVSLKNGLFWHYLEARDKPIFVEPERVPICHPLHLQAGAPLLRVSYFEKRLNFEISHMISDGRGALMFFEDLLSAYCQRRYHVQAELPHGAKSSHAEKAEDSFLAHYDRSLAHAPVAKLPYHIRSAKSPDVTTYLEAHLKTADVIRCAKALSVTVSSLLIAIVVRAIARSVPKGRMNKPIRIGVPVDLRELYHSTTSRNFFGMTYVDVLPDVALSSLENIARAIHVQLKSAIEPEKLAARMNRMVSLEKSKLIALAPSPLKDFGIRLGEWWTNKGVTSTVSNLGIAHLSDVCSKFVENINILTATKDLNFTAISYGSDFSLTISSVLVNQTVLSCVLQELSEISSTVDIHVAEARPSKALLSYKAKNVTFHYDTFPHTKLARARAIAINILAGFSWAGFAALIILALIFHWPFFIPALACGGLWANFLFVRNIMRRSLGFVRAASRYYYILYALCLVWFLTTNFEPVLSIALPICALAGIAFDFCLLPILRADVVRDYAKYLFFNVALGFLPLILALTHWCELGPLAIISTALSFAFACALLIFLPKHVFDEAKKFFSAKK